MSGVFFQKPPGTERGASVSDYPHASAVMAGAFAADGTIRLSGRASPIL